ncbi:MAG: hypothetical protein ABIE84_01160, partial [bacterium]
MTRLPKYHISDDNQFVITNYNQAPTFASFFPGIAGVYGSPMWVFYANRGQAITSIGVQNKDGAIIEFQPANTAYRTAPLTGFRTFIKVDGKTYEAFNENSDHENSMHIATDHILLVEENEKLKVRVEITYFTVPNESCPSLARNVKIVNLANKSRKIEIIDGLPLIVPYGFNDDLLKRISQTTAAWCMVENLDNDVPYFRLSVSPADVCETIVIEKGNFLAASSSAGKIKYIVEPTVVFGVNSSLVSPDNFFKNKTFTIPKEQLSQGFIPCAMAYKKLTLAAKKEFNLYSLIGQADNIKQLTAIKKKVTSQKFFEKKFRENQELIDQIAGQMETNSSNLSFDLYTKHTYIDNVMRGGLPVTLGNKTIYLYYRKHGDMERDYNNFQLNPTYFSQGNGNYRDINQNRRNDLFFNPAVSDDNVVRFFDLVQLDGFNPLVVMGTLFEIKEPKTAQAIIRHHLVKPTAELTNLLTRPFMLGPLLKGIELAGLELKTSLPELANDLLNKATAVDHAFHGEGYWIDHFCYNTDLLESYECLFPEKVTDLLFNKPVFTFFDNDHVVLPRSRKYCKYCDQDDQIRQLHSVVVDQEKADMIQSRQTDKNVVRINNGQGEPLLTTLAAKLVCILVNKVASFDAEGIGLEMEAGKPDWYDALNGLPALLGSSLSETLELKRLAIYLKSKLTTNTEIALPKEIKEFLHTLSPLFAEADPFTYWDLATAAKENYRLQTKLGVSGDIETINSPELIVFLNQVIEKCTSAVKKCLKKYKNYYTYFINEVVKYEKIDGSVKVKKFCQRPLPLFLEGFVHALKVEKDREIPKLVKESSLYDKKLKMYKVNASLKDETIEIGRTKIFTPGWLENESIWLHMEYKYLLELIKAGLYDDFFAAFKDVLIPFLKPEKYGRSILENSSFLVSSANPNKNNHGRGFVARLSGATAEFIDIWLIMMTGKQIFYVDKSGRLCFQLRPKLPAWLFKKGILSFKLLGSIDVTYEMAKVKNTYDKSVKISSYTLTLLDGKKVVLEEDYVPEP